MNCFIKICGITSIADANLAIEEGANAIGLMRFTKSPRYLENVILQQIYDVIPVSVKAIPVFVNESSKEVDRVLNKLPNALPQFHGDESPEYCESFGVDYIKAINMDINVDLLQESERYKSSIALLLDSKVPNILGGSGLTFDWNLVDDSINKSLILAGGLTPENIKSAISSGQYWGVDVSSGVESSPGKKDRKKLANFIKNVKEKK